MNISCRSLEVMSLTLLMLLGWVKPGWTQEAAMFSGADARSVAFSSDGRWIAAGGLVSPKVRSADPPAAVNATLDGADGIVQVWEAASEKVVFQHIDTKMEVDCVAFSPTGSLLAVGYKGRGVPWKTKLHPLIIWDVTSKKKVLTLPGVSSYQAIAFSPNGKWLATASVVNPGTIPARDASRITIWELPSGRPCHTWETSRRMVGEIRDPYFAVAFSPDSNYVAFGGNHGRLYIGHRESGKIVHKFASNDDFVIASVDFSSDGKWLATAIHEKSAINDTIIRVYDWNSKMLTTTIPAHKNTMSTVAFSPDSKVLYSAGSNPVSKMAGGTWKAWQVPGWKLLHTAKAHSLPTTALAVSPVGRCIVTGAMDGTVKLWQIPETWKKSE